MSLSFAMLKDLQTDLTTNVRGEKEGKEKKRENIREKPRKALYTLKRDDANFLWNFPYAGERPFVYVHSRPVGEEGEGRIEELSTEECTILSLSLSLSRLSIDFNDVPVVKCIRKSFAEEAREDEPREQRR